MLISFSTIVRRYGIPKGVIHIGAHLMEERNDYLNYNLNNTIWIEANPSIYEQILPNKLDSEAVFNYAVCDVDGSKIKLNVTNNGQSSSILELELHKHYHPHIHVTDVIEVDCKRMDTLIVENNIDINNYNFINLDIQGAELLALKGFGVYLSNMDYIYTEINSNHIYSDCALLPEMDSYLYEYGFHRVETSMTEYEWGDALYLKLK